MDSRHPAAANVVDLAAYLARRAEPELPLFARPMPGRPAVISEFRRLSAREVEHRVRMLAHLRSV